MVCLHEGSLKSCQRDTKIAQEVSNGYDWSQVQYVVRWCTIMFKTALLTSLIVVVKLSTFVVVLVIRCV